MPFIRGIIKFRGGKRGYREYEDPHMYDWVLDDFAREVEKLETAVMDHN